MATATKHVQRSHYSSHNYKPFNDFHRRAYVRTQAKSQKSMFSKLKDAVTSSVKKLSHTVKGDR